MDPTGARGFFPLTKQFIFMNHAGVSPMSERSKAALEHLMEQLVTRPYPDGMSEEVSERLRTSVGRLVGAAPDTIGLVRGTAHGFSLLAESFDWRPGDNVVGIRGEYPGNVDPWMALRDQAVEYRRAAPVEGRVTPQLVLSLVDERTRVVTVSHVELWNGYRVDLDPIGSELQSRGVIFAVDADQSAGALRLDLEGSPVDFVCAAAHRWLLGPKGIGFCYCRAELLDRLRPVLVATAAVERPHEFFDHEGGLAGTARRLEESGLSVLEMAAFGAAVDLLLDLGPDQVERQVLSLARRLAAGLAERGYQIVEPWPREPGEDSGIVSFRRPGSTPQEVLRDLNAARVVGRTQADFVRLSPHFYNTREEVDHVLDVLAPGGVSVA
jgi:cysteine desulfurase/selenocysteine lyase